MPFKLWLLLAAALVASASERKRIDREVVTNGVTYRYVVSVPDDWTGNRTWPVILFLHGSAERGFHEKAALCQRLVSSVTKNVHRRPTGGAVHLTDS